MTTVLTADQMNALSVLDEQKAVSIANGSEMLPVYLSLVELGVADLKWRNGKQHRFTSKGESIHETAPVAELTAEEIEAHELENYLSAVTVAGEERNVAFDAQTEAVKPVVETVSAGVSILGSITDAGIALGMIRDGAALNTAEKVMTLGGRRITAACVKYMVARGYVEKDGEYANGAAKYAITQKGLSKAK